MPAAEGRLLQMSTLREEGVMAVKQTACDQLLASRVEQKLQARPPAPHFQDFNNVQV